MNYFMNNQKFVSEAILPIQPAMVWIINMYVIEILIWNADLKWKMLEWTNLINL